MRAVIQRVKESSVSADNEIVGKIGKGLTVLLGVAKEVNAAVGWAERRSGQL